MSSFREAFPSKFLKAEDLNGRPVVVTMTRVDLEDVGTGDKKEQKYVVQFAESHVGKSLVLNLINCETIAEIVGTDDVDDWPGHVIELFPTKTEFAGKRVPCIRVRPPTKAKAPVPAAPPAQKPAQSAKPGGKPAARPSAHAADDLDDAMPTLEDPAF